MMSEIESNDQQIIISPSRSNLVKNKLTDTAYIDKIEKKGINTMRL